MLLQKRIIGIAVLLWACWVHAPAQDNLSIYKEIKRCEQKVEANRYTKNDSIEYFALRQLELAQQINDSLEIGKAHLTAGIAYFNLADYQAEINHLMTAKNIFYRLNNDYYLYRSYLEIASLYKEARTELYSPTTLLKLASNYFDSIGNSHLSARCYLELGLYQRNRYNFDNNGDSIIYYYNKALQYALKNEQQWLVGEVLNDIADYYLLNPHKNEDSVINISKRVLDQPEVSYKNKAVAHLNTYLAKRMKHDEDSLLYHLNKGYSLSTYVRPDRLPSQAATLKYDYFKKKKIYDSALYYHELSGGNTKAGYKQLNFLKVLFDSKSKEAQLASQKRDSIANDLARQELINIVLIASGGILTLFVVLVISKNRRIRIQKDELQEKHNQIESLIKEIHHRVKNNLQMIVGLLDLQESSTTDEAISVVLNDTSNRIKSIALVHQKLYRGNTDMISIGFQTYIEELCDNLLFSYNRIGEIDIQFDIDEIEISFDKAVIFGLLITELITNSLKHAFVKGEKGEIVVSVKKNNESEIELIIKDNGAGLPSDFDEHTTSFGIDMIRSFVSNLNGTIKFVNDNGTTVEVKLFDLLASQNGKA